MLLITVQLFLWAVNTEFEVMKELASVNVYVKLQQETIFSDLRKH